VLFGKPFHAVAACVADVGFDGRVRVDMYDVAGYDVKLSCGTLSATAGARNLAVELPWKAGEKLDLATHRVAKTTPAGYVAGYNEKTEFELKVLNKDFKPTGFVEVLRAGSKPGDMGRIRVSFVNGTEKIEGEIDVYVKREIPAP
jgi:hypothetical protein